MKKILYSLMAIGGLFATSCATFDDPVTETYPDGPAVTITVTETTDSTFTFTVNADGASFYSILVDQADEAVALSAESLYKGSYSSVYNKVVNASETATFTYNMRDAKGAPLCLPNTTYQIYAVAGSDKGMIGEIAVQAVTTTDALAPKPVTFAYDAENKVAAVTFSEPLTRGEGAVTAKAYKVNDITNPDVIAAEDLVVEVDGKVVYIAAPTSAAGAYVAFSWEAGAFVDGVGAACGALNSGLNMTTGAFAGVYGHNDNVAFAITEENVTEPELGGSFGDWTEFLGTITLPMDIYRDEKNVAAGDITVIYSNETTTKTIKLAADNWGIEGKQLMFFLPEAPTIGDWVGVKIAAGAVTDVYGNEVEEVEFTEAWLCSYGYKRDTFLGNYNINWVGYWDGKANTEAVTIAADPESETGVVISGLFDPSTKVTGEFDGDYGTITIPVPQLLGTWTFYLNAEGTETADYAVFFHEGTGSDKVVLNLNADGSFTTANLWGYFLVDPETGSGVTWYDAARTTSGEKVEAATAAASTMSVKTLKVKNASLKIK